MLPLWYIFIGWKEYNKPYRKAEQTPKPAEPTKKPDLIPQKKDVIPTQPQDIKKPDPSKSFPIDPKPANQPEPSFFNNKTPETPKTPEVKPTPKLPDFPKIPESPKATPKTPETPKMPELPKTTPQAPKIPPRTPDSPKMPDFKLAPEVPRKPESPKTPEPPTFTPKMPEPPNPIPSRRPESVMPEFPPSSRNPLPQSNQSEFPIPPYLPGAPGATQHKPLSRDDELFSMGSAFNNPSPNKPSGNLRDLSYPKGEFPGEEVVTKVTETITRIPKYMEQSVISNPDSLESDEEDEDF